MFRLAGPSLYRTHCGQGATTNPRTNTVYKIPRHEAALQLGGRHLQAYRPRSVHARGGGADHDCTWSDARYSTSTCATRAMLCRRALAHSAHMNATARRRDRACTTRARIPTAIELSPPLSSESCGPRASTAPACSLAGLVEAPPAACSIATRPNVTHERPAAHWLATRKRARAWHLPSRGLSVDGATCRC